MLEKITPYYFDQTTNQWTKSNTDRDVLNQPKRFPLRIATFNVLTDFFPWFIELAIQSNRRFDATSKMIAEQLDADVIGMNEVTSSFIETLMQNPIIRSQYYFSDINWIENKKPGQHNYTANNTLGARMGNLILSRIPFKELYRLKLEGNLSKATR